MTVRRLYGAAVFVSVPFACVPQCATQCRLMPTENGLKINECFIT